MFDSVRNNPKVVQLILGVLVLPFALWGVDSYVRGSGAGDEIAKVGNSKITRAEFQNALRDEQERMRSALGPEFRPEMLDTPEAKQVVLDNLIGQRILALHTQNAHLSISDEQLRDFIAGIPALQENGKFSKERYQRLVQAQGMSEAVFESRLRSELAMQKIPLAVGQSTVTPKAMVERWLAAQLEQRQVAEHLFKVDSFTGQVKLAADAVQKYYDEHSKDFQTPAQVMVEYLMLSQEDIAANLQISDAQAKEWFDKHQDRYKGAEERRASHILITVAKDAPEAAVKAAQAKAEALVAQLKKAPNDFAKLAKENSGDPGSAERGGDLGFFGRGSMVPPFEDAAFSQKEGEVGAPVRSDFGFHIIKVTGVKGGESKSFAQMREQIIKELKAQNAARQYAEAADAFTNMVYEQADSLKPTQDKFKLALRKSAWITQGQPAAMPFNHPKLVEKIFADDAVNSKRNTEAVEVMPNVLVSARVLEHRPAAQKALADVQADISKKLAAEEATKLALKAGQDALAGLQKGGSTLSWEGSVSLSRASAARMPAEAVKAIFSADPSKLPAYAGTALPDGSYAVYKVSAVESKKPDPHNPLVGQLSQRYNLFHAQDQMASYFTALKQRYPVVINKAALDAKER